MERGTKRRLVGCAGFLLAGLCVSLLVAQACALWAPLRDPLTANRKTTAGSAAWVYGQRGTGVSSLLALAPDPGARFDRLVSEAAPLWDGKYGADAGLPLSQNLYVQPGFGIEYETFMMGYDATDADGAVLFGARAGWPWPCLYAERFSKVSGWNGRPSIEPYWLGALTPPRFLHAAAASWNLDRVMPLAPLWGGMFFNAVFWAVPIGLLWMGPGAVRRRLRERAGRCSACGYSLAGLAGAPVCPECGAAGLRA